MSRYTAARVLILAGLLFLFAVHWAVGVGVMLIYLGYELDPVTPG